MYFPPHFLAIGHLFWGVYSSLPDWKRLKKIAYGVFHEKGAKFWKYKMDSCGVVFWNKINSFGESANNPKAQKKMICFFEKT